MKISLVLLFLLVLSAFSGELHGQTKRRVKGVSESPRAVVVDERLAVVRDAPDLGATPIVRLRRGRTVIVTASKMNGGLGFYKIAVSKKRVGWIQREALAARARKGDDERLARLIFASDGFERIDRGRIFLELFSDSPRRPAVLLDVGDRVEDFALKLSRDASRRLKKREIEASDSPRAAFYLSFAPLDRFRKIGIRFVFDESDARFHYDGAAWRELVGRYPRSAEAIEAARRLTSSATALKLDPP